MPKQDKTPKKKSKKKSPQKSGESEYPAMDQEEYNRLLQNAIEQIKAEAEQKFEERLKAVEADREAQIKVAEDRLTKKFDDEVLASEVQRAFEESRGAKPTTKWPCLSMITIVTVTLRVRVRLVTRRWPYEARARDY